jgi:hypothetical protein
MASLDCPTGASNQALCRQHEIARDSTRIFILLSRVIGFMSESTALVKLFFRSLSDTVLAAKSPGCAHAGEADYPDEVGSWPHQRFACFPSS